MPLVAMTELFQRAREGSYAVGYFEAWDTYSLEAVLEAAEAESSPVILGFGCMMADALGFNATHAPQSRTYEELLGELPEHERSRFPRELSEITYYIGSKINSIEST